MKGKNLLTQIIERSFKQGGQSGKIVRNIAWLSFDKLFRMGVGLLVGLWIARYLGPAQFGTLNYLYAIVTIFLTISTLGMDSIVVKDILEMPDRTHNVLSSVFSLRMIMSLIFFTVSVILMYFSGDFKLGIILSAVLFFNPVNTVDLFYQSRMLSKYTVLSQILAFFISSALRIVLIVLQASLTAFGIAILIEAILSSIFMLFAFAKVSKERLRIELDFILLGGILKKSWPLVFSSLLIIIYMKIDQIMLGRMLGDYQVGVYSSALRLSEIWYFIPVVICNSFYPSLVEFRKADHTTYLRRLQQLLGILVLISLPISIFFSFFSSPIIQLLFGSGYRDAGPILSVHIWTATFVFLGVGGGLFFVIEDLNTKAFTRSIFGVIINVGLNFLLIPIFSSLGAALSTLTAQIFSTYLFDALSSSTRPLFIMKTKALVGFHIFKSL